MGCVDESPEDRHFYTNDKKKMSDTAETSIQLYFLATNKRYIWRGVEKVYDDSFCVPSHPQLPRKPSQCHELRYVNVWSGSFVNHNEKQKLLKIGSLHPTTDHDMLLRYHSHSLKNDHETMNSASVCKHMSTSVFSSVDINLLFLAISNSKGANCVVIRRLDQGMDYKNVCSASNTMQRKWIHVFFTRLHTSETDM